MHAARIAAVTVPLLVALIGTGAYDNPSLIGGACGVAALLAIASGLILLPSSTKAAALALLTAAGTVPVLAHRDRRQPRCWPRCWRPRWQRACWRSCSSDTGLPRIVTQIWSALSAVSG